LERGWRHDRIYTVLWTLPYYIDNLRELHLHASLAFRFSDVIDFVVQDLSSFLSIPLTGNKELKQKFRMLKEKLKLLVNLSYPLLGRSSVPSLNKIASWLLKLQKGIPLRQEIHYTKDFSFRKVLCKSLSFFYEEKGSQEEKLLAVATIVLLNDLFNLSIHDRLFMGLDYFSRRFIHSNPFSEVVSERKKIYEKVLQGFLSSQPRLRYSELRITPKPKKFRNLKEILKSFKNIGIVVHFIKLESSEEFEEIEKKYRKVFNESKILADFLKSEPLYTRYLVGIDAASMEYWTPAWVFAPLYAFWRKKAPYYIRELQKRKQPPLRFTYHAGEDFVDLAAGLKSIYEAIKFLELQSGDRIGHGLALGMDVNVYSSRFREIRMNPLYYFFHLLWLNYLTYKHPELHPYTEKVLRELLRLSEEEKFLKEVMEVIKKGEDLFGSGFIDFKLFMVNLYDSLKFDFVNLGDDSLYGKLWRDEGRKGKKRNFKKEHSFLRKLFPAYREKSKVKKNVYILSPLLDKNSDFSFDEQLQFLEKIQKVVLNLIIKRGIVVETCPTSNVYIRGLVDYREHLVFKFAQHISRKELRVTLNTDNPLIFDTTILEEFLLVHEALPEEFKEIVTRRLIGNAENFSFLSV
jgi:adenosine deaminase